MFQVQIRMGAASQQRLERRLLQGVLAAARRLPRLDPAAPPEIVELYQDRRHHRADPDEEGLVGCFEMRGEEQEVHAVETRQE